MTKEILTTENIKNDLRKYYSDKIKKASLSLLLIICKCIIIIKIGSWLRAPSVSDKLYYTVITILIIVFGALFLYTLYVTIATIIHSRQAKKGNFTITSDWVVEKKPKKYRSRNSAPEPYKLIFAKSGECDIPIGKNYQWAGPFATYDDTLYEQTEINEGFYVIRIGGQKNVMAYRKKHFELISYL